MKAILFGGSGMIGQGVLRELLSRPEFTEVVAVGRTPLGLHEPALRDLVRPDLTDYTGLGDELSGVDAVFFCLGVSSGGMSEDAYRKITNTIPLQAARALFARSPGLTFCFISGAGADPKSKALWARAKGEAELALQKVGFKAVYCFRPGYIQPMDGIVSKTPAYRWLYVFTKPLYPLFKGAVKHVTTTRQLGFAMVEVAKRGYGKTVLESADINAVRP